MNQLQALAMDEGQRRKKKLWDQQGTSTAGKASARYLGIAAVFPAPRNPSVGFTVVTRDTSTRAYLLAFAARRTRGSADQRPRAEPRRFYSPKS